MWKGYSLKLEMKIATLRKLKPLLLGSNYHRQVEAAASTGRIIVAGKAAALIWALQWNASGVLHTIS